MIERPTPAAPRPAATVVLLRPRPDGLEVLLTRRPASMPFGANLFVFPGGRLDRDEDARTAAARETLEETGIELDPATLVPLSRWVTPPSLPIRYDTRFFGTVVGGATDVVRPSGEVVEWRWLRPTAALEAMAAARLAMWQPTVVTLQQLERITDEGSLEQAFDPGAPGPTRAPGPMWTEPAAGPGSTPASETRVFDHAWAGGIEGRDGRIVVIGSRRWVVVDPGDPTGETTARVAAAAEAAGAGLAGVAITSLDPARHAGVEMLATGLGLPVAGPPGASGLVPYAVTELADGQPVPFGDVPLEARIERARSGSGSAWSERAAEIRLVPATTTSSGEERLEPRP